jgi:hypothetical protein
VQASEGKQIINLTNLKRFLISDKGFLDLAAQFKPEVSEAQMELDAVIEELDTKLDR